MTANNFNPQDGITEETKSDAPKFVRPVAPRRALEANFQQAEFKRTVWHLQLREGESREDILRPDFWTHIRSRVKQNDHIEITHEHANYFAELIVIASDSIGLRVAFLRELDLSKLESSSVDEGDYMVKFRGPRKFSIIRRSDNVVIEENIATEGMAKQRLRDMSGDHAA